MVSHAKIGDLVRFKTPKNARFWTDENGQEISAGSFGIVTKIEPSESSDSLDPDIWYSHTIFITSTGIETPGWETFSFDILCSSEALAEGAHENLVSSRS